MTLFDLFSTRNIILSIIIARYQGMCELIEMYADCLVEERAWGDMEDEIEKDLERINTLLSEYPDYVMGGLC